MIRHRSLGSHHLSTYIRRFGRFIVLVLLSLLFLWILNNVSVQVLTIKKIEVVGEGLDIRIDPSHIPNNLLFFPTDTVVKELLHTYPQLSKVSIKKRFPNTLVIEMMIRDPRVRVKTSHRSVVADQHGIVLRDERPGDILLPLFATDIASVSEGYPLSDARVLRGIQIVDALKELPIERVSIRDATSYIFVINGINTIITQEVDPVAAAATLQTLLTRFRMNGRVPTVVDLRFDKPIITY